MIERVFGVVVTTEVGPLDEAVEGVGAVDIVGASTGRGRPMCWSSCARVRAKLAAVEARLVARVDVARPWAEAGYLGTRRRGWRRPTTRRWTRPGAMCGLARRLRSMPATARALAAGDITLAARPPARHLVCPRYRGGVRGGRGVPGGSGPLDAVGRLRQGLRLLAAPGPPRTRTPIPTSPTATTARCHCMTGCGVPGCCPGSSPPPPRPRSVPSSTGSNAGCSRPTGLRPRPCR